jgi:streptogramin lyase
MANDTSFIAGDTAGIPGPAQYSPLSIQGHSLDSGVVGCNQGQWSFVAEAIRTNMQAKTLYNFQMLTRGIWSNPTGIGWTPQRATVFNGGAAFMDFGVFEDFVGNQTLLFQVGDQVYSYNFSTSTETAYDAPLTGLSTSLVNLPCMRSFVDNTGNAAPITVYCNGAIQPVAITGTAAADVRKLNFQGTGTPTSTNTNGGELGQSLSVTTYDAGVYFGQFATTAGGTPRNCCLGPDGNVWYTDYANSKIGKVTPGGTVTEYATTTGSAGPLGICLGSDGNLWFTENLVSNIGKITTAGVVTEYAGVETGPVGICNGPNGDLYVSYANGVICWFTTAGTFVSDFNAGGACYGICSGPDSRIWFLNQNTTVSVNAMTIAGSNTSYTAGLPLNVAFNINSGICTGSDGRLWFTDEGNNSIGAITTAGAVTNYPVPTLAANVLGICAGPDNNLWFSENNSNKIGRITTAGVVTEFNSLPAGSSLMGLCIGADKNLWFCESGVPAIGTMVIDNSDIIGIAVGSDDNLWFTEFAANKIGTYNILGTVFHEYPLPNAKSAPYCIASDGTNLWFTEYFGNRIGKITTAGVITEYNLTTAGSLPVGICLGPDGNMWFTESGNNKVAKITSGGTITEYALTTGSSTPWGICSDGTNLWVCESTANKIAKVTTTGSVIEYTIPTLSSLPLWCAKGSDGRIWFTENSGNKIGAVTTSGAFTEYIIPTVSALPQQITGASNGDLYFVESGANQVAQITVTGTITEYPLDVTNADPIGIVDGPDQSIWITDSGAGEITNFLYGGSGSWPGVFQLTKKTYSMPKYCTYFNNRMVYFGFESSSNAALDVLISNQGNAEQFITSAPIQATDAYSATIPGLGLPTGCFAFRPQNIYNQEVLILGFQRGIAVIAGNQTSSDATTYEVTILTHEYGLMSNRTFVQIQNDVYFLSTNGVRNYASLIVNANLLNEGLTYQMQDVIQDIDTTLISGTNINYNSQAFAVHYRPTLEVQFWYPSTEDGVGGTDFTNQNAIIMNYNTVSFGSAQLQPIFSTKGGMSAACGIYFQGNMYCGGYNGILQIHYSGSTYNGNPIPGTLELALINNGNVQQSQEQRQALIICEGENQQCEVITYFYTKGTDNSLSRAPSPEGTQYISAPASTNTIMGSWIMGVDSFPANHIKHLYFEATGQGPYLSYTLTTNGVTDVLNFVAAVYTLEVGGLRP